MASFSICSGNFCTASVWVTWPLWLCVAGGFSFGACLGNVFVFMGLGVCPLLYGQWDSSREQKIKTLLAKSIILLIITAVGILIAKLAGMWGLIHI